MVHEMGSALLLTILAPFPSDPESPPLSPSTSRILSIFLSDHLSLLSSRISYGSLPLYSRSSQVLFSHKGPQTPHPLS